MMRTVDHCGWSVAEIRVAAPSRANGVRRRRPDDFPDEWEVHMHPFYQSSRGGQQAMAQPVTITATEE
ncbi:hypothetical protein GCM10009689_22960 [Brevibacterium antiquum]